MFTPLRRCDVCRFSDRGDTQYLEMYHATVPLLRAALIRMEGREEVSQSTLKDVQAAVELRLKLLEDFLSEEPAEVHAAVHSGERQMRVVRKGLASLRLQAQAHRDFIMLETSRALRIMWRLDAVGVACLGFLLLMCAVSFYGYKLRASLHEKAHALQVELNAVQETTRLKSKFLSNISHELQTVGHTSTCRAI